MSDAFKDADGTWVDDYGGYMSIGFDSATIDHDAYRVLPPVDGAAMFVSVEQNKSATEYLKANWANAIG